MYQTPQQQKISIVLCVPKMLEVRPKTKSKPSKHHSDRLVFSAFQHIVAKIPVKLYLFNRKCVGWCRSASSHPVTYSHMLKSELLLQYIMCHPLILPLKCIHFDHWSELLLTTSNSFEQLLRSQRWIRNEPIFDFFFPLVDSICSSSLFLLEKEE